MKKLRHLFAAALSLAMTAVMLPVTSVAADSSTVGQSGIVTDKSVTLEEDGTYTIELSAYATGSTTTVTETTTETSSVPLDIVFVVDQSGSMGTSGYLQPTRDALTNVVKTIQENAAENNVNHRVAIVGYASAGNDGTSGSGSSYSTSAGSSTRYWVNTGLFVDGRLKNYGTSSSLTSSLTAADYQAALVSANTNGSVTPSITTAISNLAANGATRTSYGLDMAAKVFENNAPLSDDAQRVVILFTDGRPGTSGFNESEAEAAIQKAYDVKNTYGAKVYSVGLYANATDELTKFMNRVSSNYPTANQFTDEVQATYEPVAVNAIDDNATYYVINNDRYVAVRRYWALFGYRWRENFWSTDYYYPEGYNFLGTTREPDQFYARIESSNAPEQKDTKYYSTTAHIEDLNDIFKTISKDVTSTTTESSSTITLNGNAVLKDIMANGFEMTNSSTIKAQCYEMTTSDGKNYTSGNEKNTSTTVKKVSNTEVQVTGFNYSSKYVAPRHAGEKLVVTITGVVPTDASAKNAIIETNDNSLTGAGIYSQTGVRVEGFPKPTTIVTNYTYVVDYAKPFTMDAADLLITSSPTVYGSFTKAAVASKYGTLNGNTFTPNTTKWDGADSFYVFGTSTDSKVMNASANYKSFVWGKWTVVPANNVYYEDDFTSGNNRVGIVYTGTWTTDGRTSGNEGDAGEGVHGWVDSLKDDATYSDGSAHVAHSGAKAEFSFTGTGVDVYSRTDMTTGTVMASLSKVTDGEEARVKTLIVDNKAKNDEYYQVPTLSFNELEYGEYKVTITVTSAAAKEDRDTYYIDGIRVYNPAKGNAEVEGEYSADEVNAVFTEIRDMLSSGSVAFIDENADGNPVSIVYGSSNAHSFAPENEVYLAPGQSAVFTVNAVNSYYVGMKAPQGTTKALLTNGSNDTVYEAEVGHTADLYYKVTPVENGNTAIITISNTGSKVLSLTKIRSAGEDISKDNIGVDDITAANAAAAAKTARRLPYSTMSLVEEEPEAPAVEITEPTEEPVQETVTKEKAGGLFSGIKSLFKKN